MFRLTRHPVFSFQRSQETRGAGVRPRGTKSLLERGPSLDELGRSLPGGDSRDRTGNLRLAKPALSQLSYIP
jgi:hypothetical protein